MARESTRRPEKADPLLRTWLVLIGAAQNRQTIPEQTLGERAGLRSSRAIDAALARVETFCRTHRLPPLAALVVGRATDRSRVGAAAGDALADHEAVFAHDWYAIRPPTEADVQDEAAPGASPAQQRPRTKTARDRTRGGATQPRRRVTTRVHDPEDIPDDERTGNVGDDAAAAEEEAPQGGTRGGGTRSALTGWRVAKCLLALRAQVDARAPQRKKTADGTIGDAAHAARTSDHNPWVRDGSVGVVTAMDVTHDPAGGCDANALVEAIRASRDRRVKYVIWNRRIASAGTIAGTAPWTWRTYTGANPHTKHVHISVQPDKAAYDSTAPWTL